jgi:hypothetical protein
MLRVKPIVNLIARLAMNPYCISASASLLISTYWLRQTLINSHHELLSSYGDILWNLASVQVWMSSGPISADPHLSFGSGFSPWKLPQMGLLSGFVSWFSGLFGASVDQAFSLTIIVGAMANSLALYFMFAQVTNNFKWLRIIASVQLGSGVFTLGLLGHSQVRQYYAFYFGIGILLKSIRSAENSTSKSWIFAILVFAVSPMWAVFIFIIVQIIVLAITSMRKLFKVLKQVALVLLLAVVGIIPQFILYFLARDPNTPVDRGYWDANIYGGHFVDFLVSSPLVRNKLNLNRVTEGASIENNQAGILVGILSMILILFILKNQGFTPNAIQGNSALSSVIHSYGITVIFLFTLGGFGNLIAGLTAIFGIPSPSRAYSRLIILLGALGFLWILMILEEKKFNLKSMNMKLYLLLCMFLIATPMLELKYTFRETPVLRSDLQEHKPVKFLSNNLSKDCIVAQLPIDTFPINLAVREWKDVPEYYFKGFIPYLLDPKLNWTFGTSNPSNSQIVGFLTKDVGVQDLLVLESKGVCAILFDKNLAQHVRTLGIDLKGSNLPSNLVKKDFGRYEVILLNS